MQIVIDIPEEDYILATKEDFSAIYNGNHIAKAIKDGTPLPDNATNGDVIKAMFEPNRITRTDDVVTEEYEFNEVWWNEPYQKGGKE